MRISCLKYTYYFLFIYLIVIIQIQMQQSHLLRAITKRLLVILYPIFKYAI